MCVTPICQIDSWLFAFHFTMELLLQEFVWGPNSDGSLITKVHTALIKEKLTVGIPYQMKLGVNRERCSVYKGDMTSRYYSLAQ